MTFGSCRYHWGQCWHHMAWYQHNIVPMATSMAPLHSMDQDSKNEVQYDLFGHVMLMAPSLAPLHSFCYDG